MRSSVAALSVLLALASGAAMAAGSPDDCSTTKIPRQKAKGKIGAVAFVPNDISVSTQGHYELNGVVYDPYDLSFEGRDADSQLMTLHITIIVPTGQKPDGKTFRLLPIDDGGKQPAAGAGAPEVQGWHVEHDPGVDVSSVDDIGSLRLDYGKRKGGTVPGAIAFCTQAGGGSFLGGTFEAHFGR